MKNIPRHDGRSPSQPRPIKIQRGFTRQAGGSVLISFGNTRVLCTAMLDRDLPPWLRARAPAPAAGSRLNMPCCLLPRRHAKRRDSGKPDGRSVEIQRLVGRALRSCIDLQQLVAPGNGAGLTLFIDCDVLQADGGTRTAAITGAWVAVSDAIAQAKKAGLLEKTAAPLTGQVAAVSVGIVNGTPVLDLDYVEDVDAHVDMNVAMLADDRFVEVQGTGEHATFSVQELQALLELAMGGIRELHQAQLAALKRK